MKKFALLPMFALALIPTAGQANSTLNVTITATVPVFCRIFTPGNNELIVQNGQAAIGQVSEICNTPNGYEVATSFSNVTGGELNVGGSAYPILDGVSRRVSMMPAAQTLNWQLSRAQLAMTDTPVVMRVTITPR